MGLSTKQVSNDHALDWGQALLESGSVELPKPPPSRRQQQNQQQQPDPLKCPRCGSMNTKFCYYNNYNKSQPRHFCKACKRHWTKGGTLRNVPVGGGRKNKRLKISNTATNTTTPAAAANTATKNDAHIVAHGQQDCHNFPFAPLSDQTKNISDVLCRALMSNPSSISNEAINTLSGKHWMSNKNSFPSSVSPILSLPQDQSLQFSFPSSLSPYDTIPCSFPSSNLSLRNSIYDYTGELDHVESTSTITTVTPATSAVFPQSWQGPTSSGMAEVPNYWNWNDVDPFASSDLNISWDEI